MIELGKCRIAVIGSGSGLPAPVGLAKHFDPRGFDLKTCRMTEVRTRRDSTPEVGAEGPPAATHLSFRRGLQELRTCHADSVTVPPPIGEYVRPELSWLIGASTTTGQVLTQGDLVYESTFYPSCTEATSVSTLERISSLKFNRHFSVGYSADRINQDATVIENTPHEVKIALTDALARTFARRGINTEVLLRAAGSRGNCSPFRATLVGGHGITVNPCTFMPKAQELGHHLEMMAADRFPDDDMPTHVAVPIINRMTRTRISVSDAREDNCLDTRHCKISDVIRERPRYRAPLDALDLSANAAECKHECALHLARPLKKLHCDATVIAVATTSIANSAPRPRSNCAARLPPSAPSSTHFRQRKWLKEFTRQPHPSASSTVLCELLPITPSSSCCLPHRPQRHARDRTTRTASTCP